MGSKKTKKEPPSAQEKMAAAVGLAEYRIFKDLYLGNESRKGPLLKMRDQAQNEDFTRLFQGRANADLVQQMQQESGAGKYLAATDITRAAQAGKALGKGKQKASANALKAKADQQSKVLAAARKQAAVNNASLAKSAQIDTGEAIAGYNAKVKRKAAQMAMVSKAVRSGAVAMGKEAAFAKGEGKEPELGGAFTGGMLQGLI